MVGYHMYAGEVVVGAMMVLVALQSHCLTGVKVVSAAVVDESCTVEEPKPRAEEVVVVAEEVDEKHIV